jgi:putative hydrolase of the HAD superfamily
MSNISCILFDLGGVIVNWHDSWLIDEVSRQFQLSKQKLADEFRKNLTDLACGRIDEQEFWFRIGQELNSPQISKFPESLLGKIFRKHVTLNKSILSLSRRLVENNVPVGILSNTESVTFSVVEDMFSLEHFRFKFLSYEIGHVKPDLEIYRYVINNIPFPKENLFFIDDVKTNVESARNAGIDAVQFTSFEDLLNEFDKRNILRL